MGIPDYPEIAAAVVYWRRYMMIPRIKKIKPLEKYILYVVFDDGKEVEYDVKSDMEQIKSYKLLESEYNLFEQVQLDQSRTVVFWNEEIDLPSDILYEFGSEV